MMTTFSVKCGFSNNTQLNSLACESRHRGVLDPAPCRRHSHDGRQKSSAKHKLVITVTFDYVNKIKMSNVEYQLETSSSPSHSLALLVEEYSLWIFHKLHFSPLLMLGVPLKFKKVSKLIFYLLSLSLCLLHPLIAIVWYSTNENFCPIMDEVETELDPRLKLLEWIFVCALLEEIWEKSEYKMKDSKCLKASSTTRRKREKWMNRKSWKKLRKKTSIGMM